ncbi:MAG TPA: Fe-S cluster assembly protein HesB [Streptosporangiaceae bacterium]|nr:Fe-S cluster assembly protein HesB [Streptosporangiaceae bacterium]
MLVLTEAAAKAVKSLTATPQLPEGSGLRISSNAPEPEAPGALQVAAAPGPSENDLVVEAAGAHVYLEPKAAAFLDDKVLDAQVDQDGQAHFSLGLQAPGQA